MSVVWVILGWILAIVFALLTISMFMMQNWGQALVAFLLLLLCWPPVTSLLQNRFDFSIHPLLPGVVCVG
jgi:hypothetical protein